MHKAHNIITLRQRKVELAKQARAMLDAAEAAKRDFTVVEQEVFEKTQAAMQENEKALIAEEARLLEERGMPLTRDENEAFARVAQGIGPRALPGSDGLAIRARSAKYADLFGRRALSNGGFESFNAFLRSWHQAGTAGWDPRIQAANQVEDLLSSGGAFVPEAYSAALLDRSLEAELIRPRATNFAMTTETLKIPAFDNYDQSSTLYGGFTAQWIKEGGAITLQTAKTRLMQLTAAKLALLGASSNELLADGNNFEAALSSAMIGALTWFFDYYFLRGDGAGQPLGILNDPALVTVTKDAAHSPGDAGLVFGDIASMFSRLHPSCVENAVWIAHTTTIPKLLSMQYTAPINIGAGSQAVAVEGVGGQYKLLTKPVIFTSKTPTLGTKGDLILADLSQYMVGIRTGMALEKSIHANFTTDETVFRLITRLDGQGSWKKAITPKSGPTLSWCVVCEDRT
jgi:HK97 family phage major capsid protein